MKAIIVPMTEREKLEQIDEELESARYQEFLRLQQALKARRSVTIDGVRYVRIKKFRLYRKRMIEKEELGQIEKDSEWDRYWEYLMKHEK